MKIISRILGIIIAAVLCFHPSMNDIMNILLYIGVAVFVLGMIAVNINSATHYINNPPKTAADLIAAALTVKNLKRFIDPDKRV